MFEPFWFKPITQPEDGTQVEFQLKPYTMEQMHRVGVSLRRDREPSWEDKISVLRQNVIDWKGLPTPCSAQARQDVLAGEASIDWDNWLRECIAELCTRARPSDAERKNS